MNRDRLPPRDPRAPRITYRDARLGLPVPSAVVAALAIAIAFYAGGPVAAVAVLAAVVAVAVVRSIWKGRRR